MTNLVQFPGLGLSFEINRVALSIGGFNIYWYGVCIAFGICLALVFAFRHSIEFGVDPDSMVDVILIGIVLGIVSARAYYVAMAPFKYESIWEMIAIRDGGLAIYGGIIGGFLFGGLACKRRGVPVLPMFDLTAMGFLLGQGCGRWGNFFNQEAFGCNTTLPWGMFSETTRAYLMGSTVTAQSGVTIDPNLPVHPTFLYESIWCFVGFLLLFRYIKKRKFNGDIALRYMIWYGAGRFWIEALRTDSLMLVPSIGLRASQLVAGIAVVVGVAAEIYFTHKFKDKPLMVKLAMTADNKAAVNKLSKEKTVIGLMTDADTELLASSPRKLFVERTEAYNAEVIHILANIATFTHYTKQVNREMCRIRIMQTKPFYSWYFRNAFNQFRKHLFLIPVYAVISQFLCDHLKFFHALRYQISYFVQNFLHRFGDMASCNNGNGTIRTFAVTPF